MKKTRNSNIEILRIISMIFIIISHYTVHNGISNINLSLGINRYLLEITTLGNIGVILFVLISGYFMIEQTKVKISKLFSLYMQIVFYSLGIYLLFIVFGKEIFSIKEFITNIFPIIFNKYWFATTYVVLYILSPFINKTLNSMNRKEYITFNVILLFIVSIIPTFTHQFLYTNELIQFILFYSLGAYLKKYQKNILFNKKVTIIVFVSSAALLLLSTLCFDILGTKIVLFNGKGDYMFSRFSILTIVFSVSLFALFVNKKELTNKFVNIISECMFGIYLIHDNSFVRSMLWINIFKNANYVNSNYLILHLIITVVIVFIVCTIIEYIRKNTVEKTTNKLFIKRLDNLQIYIEKSLNKYYKRIVEK